MQQSTLLYQTLAAVTVLCLLWLISKTGKRAKDLPPGPPTLPILGNIHLISKERPFLQFQKWAQEYGSIYSLILGTKTFIILSSPKAVKDLLDKKSSIYSDRPDTYLGHEIVGDGMRFVTMKYGPKWRSVHKMMHNTLNIKTAVAYIPYQDVENKDMMLAFLDHPEDFLKHVRRYTTSLTTQMVYGFRTTSRNDPLLLNFFENFEEWGKLVGAATAQALDLFPLLRRLPEVMLPSLVQAKILAKKELKMYMGNFTKTKERISSGISHPCFAYDVLKAQKTDGFSDEQAAYICGSLIEGGSDTTSGTLVGFIFAMMMFPEVQQKAQGELDRVCPDHLPSLDDVVEIPYVRQCVKETIRWMPTMIMGAPHSNLEEDYYEGYRIPKGSSIVANNWTLNMDPRRNPNPREFNPARFENDNQTEHQSAINKDEDTRQNWIFGSGRRQCQGMHIAERSLLMGMSRMLWAFNFERPKRDDGSFIPVDIDDLVGELTVQPRDFKVNITPRSQRKADLLREAWNECTDTLLDPATLQWKKIPDGMKFAALGTGIA